MLIHPIKPVYDKDSRVLILGSFPSVKSREEGFFYGHPQNRFWKVTAAIYINGKKACQLYQKYLFPVIRREGICLPSTSPANAAWNLERLTEEWKMIKQ